MGDGRWVLVMVAVIITVVFPINIVAASESPMQRLLDDLIIKYTTIYSPIQINNSTDFAQQAQNEGWPGNGTKENPYIISNYEITSFSPSFSPGIFITNTDVYFVIENCYIYNYQPSIQFFNVTHGKIVNTTLSSTLEIGKSRDIYVENSNITGYVYISTSNHVRVVGNNITNGGVDLSSSNYSLIERNEITNSSEVGISIIGHYSVGSSYNVVRYNRISHSKWVGVYIGGYNSKNNLVYNNSFYFNNESGTTYNSSHIQGSDETPSYVINSLSYKEDMWYSIKGYGNYWHDWANNNDTNDKNGDGIVDWPYKIYNRNSPEKYRKDIYSLKNPPTPNKIEPTPPVDLKFERGYVFVNLTWSAPISNGTSPLEGYKVYRDNVLIAKLSPEQTWYNDTNVKLGESHEYYVTAYSMAGESGYIGKVVVVLNIQINGDEEFAWLAQRLGWSGSGTKNDPYIISGYTMDARGEFISLIDIENTRIYFIIEGCTLENSSDYVIRFHNATNGTILNNKVEPNTMGGGIDVGSPKIIIKNNFISGSPNHPGIVTSLYGSIAENVTIINNTIVNGSAGISVYYAKNNTILNNLIYNNEYGIYIERKSYNNIIKNNTLYNNPGGDIIFYGLSYAPTYNNKLYENHMEGGIVFYHADEKTYESQNISSNNTVRGKPVYYYRNKNMYDATVPLNAGEVIIANVSYLKVEELNLSDAVLGLIVGYSNNITINNCEFARAGINIYHTSYSVITNNTITFYSGYGNWRSGAAFELAYSDHNILSNNTIKFNHNGISLLSSNNNTVLHNLFEANTMAGISLNWGSTHNLIYNNSFYYNEDTGDRGTSPQALDQGSTNYWNSTAGYGNYWCNWANNNNTNDQDGDGIVDWPYIAGGVKDYYPLKNPTFSIPPPPPKNVYEAAGDGYINITWDAPLGNGTTPITGFNIYRNGSLIATVPANQLWYNDTDVINGETYIYYITAVNSVGEGEPSNAIEATPNPPSIPELFPTWPIFFIIVIFILYKREQTG